MEEDDCEAVYGPGACTGNGTESICTDDEVFKNCHDLDSDSENEVEGEIETDDDDDDDQGQGYMNQNRHRCEEEGAEYKEFSNGCMDGCEYNRNPESILCTAMTQQGCDCGPGMCWDGDECEDIDEEQDDDAEFPNH
jgi:hypothetical protein